MTELESVFEEIGGYSQKSFFSFFAYSTEYIPIKMELRVMEEDVEFDTKKLVLVLLGMIIELEAMKKNANYLTAFLKNTNADGVYLLDGVRKLSQFLKIKCISVTKKSSLSVSFRDPIDINRIEEIMIASGEVFGEKVTATREEKGGRIKVKIIIGEREIFSLSAYAVTFFFSGVIHSPVEIKRWICAFGELVTRIHQDELFRRDNSIVSLRKYAPFLKLVTPELFSDGVAKNIRLIGEEIIKNGIPVEVLKETKPSKFYCKEMHERRFRIPKKFLSEHIAYIVFVEKTREFVIRFKLPIDIPYVAKALGERGVKLGEESIRKVAKKIRIKKGGGSRLVHSNIKSIQRPLIAEKKQFGKLEGKHILTFFVDHLDFGITVFSLIYDHKAFVSGWVETADMECDLSALERLVVQNVNDLVDFYDFFIKTSEDREIINRVLDDENAKMNDKNAFDRVVDLFYLYGSPENDFYQILLSVLKNIQERTGEYIHEFSNLEEETRERAAKKLAKMNHMIRACEKILSQQLST